ncbi:MAG: beta-glucosidase [Planctomycetes bacterium GWF2_42_9]|nr:MAG: beta-glucosidase [Planctomycetes bacterium GWF2_42_9]
MSFSDDFIWGAASAAFQIEGATSEDGRGLSVWDMMCSKPGAIYQNQNADIACDHYHGYKEDVRLMKEIGLKAYRLSLSWPRLLPSGTGKVNPAGLEFYNNLIDELLANDIVPFVTLFHWDFPLELYCRGGWLNPESPIWFKDYTSVAVEHFSDRIRNWITLNEPQTFVGQGHQLGIHAPGEKYNLKEVLRIGHNVLLAHGRAVQVIRENAKLTPNIGYAPVGVINMPASDSQADIDAARRATFNIPSESCWNSAWWMDPVFLGQYPESGLKLYSGNLPKINSGDMGIISTPVDFCGANIYHGTYTAADSCDNPLDVKPYEGSPLTAMEWPITPDGLYWGPKFLYERYKKPIYITENGMANLDWPSLDGKVHDPQRIYFISRYLSNLKKAHAEGIPVKGYFYWSLSDNFEWTFGYSKRFGLIYVDYRDQRRTLKDSAFWYKNIILSNGLNL